MLRSFFPWHMPPPAHKPLPDDIARQLKAMLANDIFIRRPQQAKFFELLVNAVLAKEEPTEKYIRAALFKTPPYKPDSTVVRRTADLVRQLLREYYDGPGKNDLVLISLPDYHKEKRVKLQPGVAYSPTFTINPNHHIATLLAKVRKDLATGNIVKLTQASETFDEILTLVPNNGDLWIQFAEVQLALSFYNPANLQYTSELLGAFPSGDITKLLHAYEIHVIRAVFHLFNRNLPESANNFIQASRTDPIAFSNEVWLPIFYVTCSQFQQAASLAKEMPRRNPNSVLHFSVSGLIHYILRDYQAADQMLTEALTIDENFWMPYLLKSLVAFAQDEPIAALFSYKTMIKFATESVFPSLPELYYSVAEKVAGLRSVAFHLHEPKPFGFSSSDPFQHALYLFTQRNKADFSRRVERQAVELLTEAWNLKNPLTMWLHLWPFLDPLRSYYRFRDLLLQTTPIPPTELPTV